MEENKQKRKIIVIGGLSAGPSAAAKARRENEDAEIIMFEKGANISYATCGIPYALSGVIEKREELIVVETNLLRTRFNIDVRLNEEVIAIDTSEKVVVTPKGSYSYDKLVFATGARSVVPPIKNIEKAQNWSTCRTLGDYDKIMQEGVISDAQNITVLGAGLIGIEVADNLMKIGKNITVIEGNKQVLPMWSEKFSHFAKNILEEKGLKVITGVYANEFEIENGKASSIIISENEKIETDFIIISAGIKPNTDLLIRQGAEHIANGALKVNEQMETSIPDVYAAGDCAAIKNLQTNEYDYFPLGTHSNKGGRTAGANAAGKHEIFKGAYKTAIIKIFDFTLARTGLNSRHLRELEIPFKTSLSIAGSTPGYYPNQKDLITEIYYAPETGKLLGAELIGEYGVDKRADVLSTAIYAGLTISDLPQLDLAYAPPFSPAKDPVVVAGFVSSNQGPEEITAEDFNSITKFWEPGDYQLLDVRTKKEFDRGHIPHAVHLDLHEIRNNLDKIDPEKPLFLYCLRGMRGYLAALILLQKGIHHVTNISGGYMVWEMMNYQTETEKSVLSEEKTIV